VTTLMARSSDAICGVRALGQTQSERTPRRCAGSLRRREAPLNRQRRSNYTPELGENRTGVRIFGIGVRFRRRSLRVWLRACDVSPSRPRQATKGKGTMQHRPIALGSASRTSATWLPRISRSAQRVSVSSPASQTRNTGSSCAATGPTPATTVSHSVFDVARGVSQKSRPQSYESN
jgi:hypothetical protein